MLSLAGALRSSALLPACAAAGARLQSMAGLSGAAAAQQADAAAPKKSVGKDDPADQFIFKEHCKGVRVESEDAKKTRESLMRTNFGTLKPKRAPAAAEHAAGQRGVHSAASALWGARGAGGEGPGADDASQELVEKGAKRMMQSDDGREELRQGTFDLDSTTERVLEEGKKDASPEAAARADDQDVRDSAKSRIVSGFQTS